MPTPQDGVENRDKVYCSLSFPLESTIRLRTCEGTDLRSFISHIKLSSENKTRVDKNEKLRRPHTEDLNHQLFKLLSVLHRFEDPA